MNFNTTANTEATSIEAYKCVEEFGQSHELRSLRWLENRPKLRNVIYGRPLVWFSPLGIVREKSRKGDSRQRILHLWLSIPEKESAGANFSPLFLSFSQTFSTLLPYAKIFFGPGVTLNLSRIEEQAPNRLFDQHLIAETS